MKEKFGEIGLAGFSNSTIFDYFPNNVTIVHQPAFEMGRVAAELLLQLIETETEEYETKVLQTTLMTR